MKNRQKFTVSEKNLVNRLERLDSEVDRRHLELRAKKKIASNPLIQKNIGFLQSYNNLFRRPSQHFGDADTFFRNSLRNYSNSFDLIRELNLETRQTLRNRKLGHRQRSNLTSHIHHNSCEHSGYILPKSRYSNQDLTKETLEANFGDQKVEGNLSLKEIFANQIEEEVESHSEDSDDKEYFSPLVDFKATFEESEEDSNLQFKEDDTNYFQESRHYTIKEVIVSSEGSLETARDKEEIRESEETQDNMAEEFGGEDMDEEFQASPEEQEDGEDDELKDVEEMIQQASEELQKVAEENQQLLNESFEGDEEEEAELQTTDLKGDDKEPKAAEAGGDGSVFKFDPAIDAALLKELEDAEKQAKATAKIIEELKDRVGDLLQKEKMTETEAKELEEKNKALKAQMILFEEKTKRIQFLLGQANLFDKMVPVQPPLQTKHAEDVLPKMLVCGVADEFMPKIVLCHDRKKDRSRSSNRGSCKSREPPSLSPMTRRLNESYNIQERLVSENADLEGTRYRLQSDLINKDQTVEGLQRQLYSLQNEMRMVYQENAMLSDKVQGCPNPSCPKNSRSNSPTGKKMACGPGKGICPADVENRLQEYSETTNQLEKQLVDVEQEVKTIQQELIEVQKEREHLEHHRKMMCVAPPCSPPPCFPPPCYPPSCPPHPCMPPPCGYPPCPMPDSAAEDQKYKELKEQYSRLQEDFKAKLTEVAGLRAENEKLKDLAKAAEETRNKLEIRVKELEKRLKDLRGDTGDKGSGSKEQLIDLQQQIKVHKELYRQAQDELEELRALVEDIQGQLNDYRNKYLEAIQTVEEQRRQIDIMKMENNRISEQVNLEILRVKNQFQEKLQELAPLPDILKATQVKLQEAQQLHLLAERNNDAMARELQTYKDKLKAIMDEMDMADSDKAAGAGEKEVMAQRIKELEQMLQESKDENDGLKLDIDQIKEIAETNERLVNEKLHEITQLESQLESVREDSARQVSRIKDRCEIVRKSMQNQIGDLERQLAQTKAAAKAAEKDRDDIRQKMQAQIRNLNENFDDAQMRMRNLQGHVNFLKNSYGGPAEQITQRSMVAKADPCGCGAEY